MYAQSLRLLQNLTRDLTQRVGSVLQGGSLTELLDYLEIEATHQMAIVNALNWKQTAKIVNPFDAKIAAIESTIKMFVNLPLRQVEFQKKKDALLNKQALFNEYLPQVQEAFQHVSISNDELSKVTEAIADHLASGSEFKRDEFLELLSIHMDEDETHFIANHEVQVDYIIDALGGHKKKMKLG